MHIVSDVFNIADERSIRYADTHRLEDTELYRLFYPKKNANETMYGDPDYDHVHQELKNANVTLEFLHEEYMDCCERNGKIPWVKPPTNEGYAEYIVTNLLTKHLV